jgi:hypothetical protein
MDGVMGDDQSGLRADEIYVSGGIPAEMTGFSRGGGFAPAAERCA